MIDISIIIVTYNNEETIKKCLDTVLGDNRYLEVIVIDNLSNDLTVELVKGYGSKVKLIKNNGNLGFAKANNMAVNVAKGDYLIFLNPDTEIIEKNTFERLIKVLEENQQYGLIGPKLMLKNGYVQKSVRRLPTVWGAMNEYIFGVKGAFDFYIPDCKKLCEVESVVGACIVMKRKVFNEIGGFNEKYFLYFEDLELCNSVRKQGLKVGYAANIKIEHILGQSGKNKNVTKLNLESSRKYFGSLRFLLIQYIGRLGNMLRSSR